MPAFLCILSVPLLIALLLACKTSGKKKILAWGVFALLALPLAVGGLGGWLLSLRGLAWRSGVKLTVGFAYVAGVLTLLLWAAIALSERLHDRRTVAGCVGACAAMLASVLLCLAVGWYGLLFSAVWAGRDRTAEYYGQTVVAEQTWTDWDYYACHGPLVRGKAALGHSWEDHREQGKAGMRTASQGNAPCAERREAR